MLTFMDGFTHPNKTVCDTCYVWCGEFGLQIDAFVVNIWIWKWYIFWDTEPNEFGMRIMFVFLWLLKCILGLKVKSKISKFHSRIKMNFVLPKIQGLCCFSIPSFELSIVFFHQRRQRIRWNCFSYSQQLRPHWVNFSIATRLTNGRYGLSQPERFAAILSWNMRYLCFCITV